MLPDFSATLQAFCAQADMLRLAYLDRQGYPRVVPVWFVLLEGAYYFGTGAHSPKWRAMQRQARVGWVVDGGPRDAYKGASLCGSVSEVRDTVLRARVYEALGNKYFHTPEHPRFTEIFGRLDDPATVYLQLTPTTGRVWEY
ncbi:MAG: pyridoxamine 5'-phosphate oxidase family protein [Candidatus Tectimicrobiota bacterium]